MAEFRLSRGAARDLEKIADYTIARWGTAQAERYERALQSHFDALARGDAHVTRPLAARPEFMRSRCEQHYVFAVMQSGRPLVILAVLHKNMDLMQRMRRRLEEPEF